MQPHILPNGARTRVLIVDDQRTFAELFATALSIQDDFECVGHASTAAEGQRLAMELDPDLVIMDVQLPDTDGLTATQQLLESRPEIRVVVLTAHTDPVFLARAAAVGACGFVAKDGSLTDVLQALRSARRGAMLVGPGVLANLAEQALPRQRSAVAAPSVDLTAREHQVLSLLAEGLDTRRVARTLGISQHTCRGHVKNLYAKLDVHSQVEAVVTASRLGLVEVREAT